VRVSDWRDGQPMTVASNVTEIKDVTPQNFYDTPAANFVDAVNAYWGGDMNAFLRDVNSVKPSIDAIRGGRGNFAGIQREQIAGLWGSLISQMVEMKKRQQERGGMTPPAWS
jgi:hypothetical protein